LASADYPHSQVLYPQIIFSSPGRGPVPVIRLQSFKRVTNYCLWSSRLYRYFEIKYSTSIFVVLGDSCYSHFWVKTWYV